jgi:hypothetical protein
MFSTAVFVVTTSSPVRASISVAAVAAAVREKLCDLRDAWMLVSMSVITSSVMWCSTTATSAPSSSIGPVDDHAAADDEDAGTAFGGFGGLFGGGGDDKYEYTGE